MEHSGDRTVIEARTAPLAAGVAVDIYARVQLEDEAATHEVWEVFTLRSNNLVQPNSDKISR